MDECLQPVGPAQADLVAGELVQGDRPLGVDERRIGPGRAQLCLAQAQQALREQGQAMLLRKAYRLVGRRQRGREAALAHQHLRQPVQRLDDGLRLPPAPRQVEHRPGVAHGVVDESSRGEAGAAQVEPGQAPASWQGGAPSASEHASRARSCWPVQAR